jgi:hypothetical protein
MSKQTTMIVASWTVGVACGIGMMLALYPSTRHWPNDARVEIGTPKASSTTAP